MDKNQNPDEVREFTPEEGKLLYEFLELLYEIDQREKVTSFSKLIGDDSPIDFDTFIMNNSIIS